MALFIKTTKAEELKVADVILHHLVTKCEV